MEKESYVHRTGRTGAQATQVRRLPSLRRMMAGDLAEIESYIGFAIPVVKAPSEEAVDTAEKILKKTINIVPELKEGQAGAIKQTDYEA